MSSEWSTVRLGDYIDSCLGKMLDQKKNKGEPHPYLGNSNVRWGEFDLTSLAEMRFEEGEHDRYGIKKGDLIICEGGEPGRCAIWDEQVPNMKIQKALHRVRTKCGLDSEYLYYWFLLAGQKGTLEPYFTGTTIKHLTGKALAELPIQLPDLDHQERCAKILRSLDEKIQANRRTNQTLEQIVQILFKSWFVDFDPVRAKVAVREHFEQRAAEHGEPLPAPAALEEAQNIAAAATIAGLTVDPADIDGTRALLEAKLTGMGAEQRAQLLETAALFPASLEDSELGVAPAGWTVSSFDDFANLDTTSVKPAAEPETEWEHYSIPAFDAGEMPAIDLGQEIKSGKYRVYESSVLVSKLNPHTSRVWAPELANPDTAVCSTEFMQFRPKNSGQRPFVYCLIRSDYFQHGILSRVTGTTGSRQRAKPKEVAVLPVFKPSRELIEKFSEFSGPILQKINANKRESGSLIATRDLLLPKLLSGEIRLNPEPVAEAS